MVAIVCPACERVLALGARLPASCFGAIAPEEVAMLTPAQLDAHPKAHHDCVELEVAVPDDLEPNARLAAVERLYAPQLAALGELVAHTAGGRR
jgi:hypothetical protein